MSRLAVLVLLTACGRIGFEPSSGALDDARVDGTGSGSGASDGALLDAAPLACTDQFLDTMVGTTAGTTLGQANDYTVCSGGTAADRSYHWIAPATGNFQIDLCASTDITWDSTLLVLADSCTGAQVACDDDSCLTSLHAKVTIAATAGASYVIVVDGSAGDVGAYTLTIAQQ